MGLPAYAELCNCTNMLFVCLFDCLAFSFFTNQVRNRINLLYLAFLRFPASHAENRLNVFPCLNMDGSFSALATSSMAPIACFLAHSTGCTFSRTFPLLAPDECLALVTCLCFEFVLGHCVSCIRCDWQVVTALGLVIRHLLEKRSNLQWLSFAALQLVKKNGYAP